MQKIKTKHELTGSKHELDPKSYTGIYSMHKYWSKKPFNIIKHYIEKYTKPGSIVMDPFCGSGISNIESLLLQRKTVGIDINPMAIFITNQMLEKTSVSSIETEFQRLVKTCKKRIDDLYLINRRNKQFVGSHFVYANNRLIEIWCKGRDNKKIILHPQKSDLDLIDGFSYDSISLPYPKVDLIENSRINVKKGMKVFELFTPRNMLALAILMNEIKKIKDKKLQDFFRFCFTASTGQASRMVFVVNKRGKLANKETVSERKEVGSWVIGYWIPKENFEINVWNCFENRYRRILKAKKEQHDLDFESKQCRTFSQLSGDKYNTLLINDNCVHAFSRIPDATVDYVITDPPHGDRLPYLELSMMWNSWMNMDVKMNDELVISDAKMRNKDVKEYNRYIDKILKEIERVLKPKGHFTLMFNNMDSRTWNNLQRTLFSLDLDLVDIDAIGYSAASVIQDSRKGGLKTDFAFTFKKKNVRHAALADADEHLIDSLVSKYMKENAECATYEILNHVIMHLMQKRMMFDVSRIIDAISIVEYKK